jgi:hypothetical protein
LQGDRAIAIHPDGHLLSPIDNGPFSEEAFYCGDGKKACPEINRFIKFEAKREHAQRRSTTFILHKKGSAEIFAYITTTMGVIRFMDGEVANVERTAGALHVANLGRARGHHEKGLGKWLVEWSLTHAEELSRVIGCRGVSLYCYDDAKGYYEDLGFEQYADERRDKDSGELKYPMLWDLAKALGLVQYSIGTDYQSDLRWRQGLQ